MSSQDAKYTPLSVSLSPITADDVLALLELHSAAFKTDQFSNLMLLNRDANAHQALMDKSIRLWMSDPEAKLTKAVSADGHVVGWSCWTVKTRYPEKSTPTRNPEPETRTDTTAARRQDQVEADTPAERKHQDQNAPRDPTRVLGGLMHRDMTSWEDKHLRGKRYMVLQALATEPRYQRQGIATRLIRHGLEEADSQDLPCWVHASPTSYKLYAKAGFEEVGRSSYDLDEWAPGGKDGNQGWGVYTFRYMFRPKYGTAV
ncbi:Putative GNAT domain, acyl-CoA N-acyltransferase [Colletotrichum destructivum]|uniref:GNAT domain, acyl-CoA N-acyltransferase n=1 Tax=Colletotrichum destructivum TaxID=34406 RepID=A0AAX4IYP7_9PEZI|nr:Putative GNAT domain, acyl-CoA N-acyltransferase [Colletotrichum destructivum]